MKELKHEFVIPLEDTLGQCDRPQIVEIRHVFQALVDAFGANELTRDAATRSLVYAYPGTSESGRRRSYAYYDLVVVCPLTDRVNIGVCVPLDVYFISTSIEFLESNPRRGGLQYRGELVESHSNPEGAGPQDWYVEACDRIAAAWTKMLQEQQYRCPANSTLYKHDSERSAP